MIKMTFPNGDHVPICVNDSNPADVMIFRQNDGARERHIAVEKREARAIAKLLLEWSDPLIGSTEKAHQVELSEQIRKVIDETVTAAFEAFWNRPVPVSPKPVVCEVEEKAEVVDND